MANWQTIDEAADGSGIYQIKRHGSVRVPTDEMRAFDATVWPQLMRQSESPDGSEIVFTTGPAKYARKIGDGYVAAPDDALMVWRAEQAAAQFAAVAAKALPMVKQLQKLLAVFGLAIPTTEAAATEAIAQMDLTDDQVNKLGALGVTWQAIQAAGVADYLEPILNTENT